MTNASPQRFTDLDQCVSATLERVGRHIVLGLPVGLGKPNTLVNAFVARALRDPGIRLQILTGLSFRKPRWHSDLERRFLEPFVRRVFGAYPELEYIRLLEQRALPANIDVTEFYLEPGAWLRSEHAQQHYLSANYTHVVRDALRRGLNAMAQLVAPAPDGNTPHDLLSLSCNPDLTADLLPHIASIRAAGRPFALIGQTHRELPFMYGDAVVPADSFDLLVDSPAHEFALFSPPNMPIGTTDYMISLSVSALVKDGGTLQLGIGELGDAIVYGLKLRHERPEVFRRLLDDTGLRARHAGLIESEGGTQPFSRGLYGCSEMLADGFLDLYRGGILKRRVYPSARIQRLLDQGDIGEEVGVRTLEALHHSGVQRLSFVDFEELRDVGVFRDDVRYEHGTLTAADGTRITVKLADPECRAAIARHCLGTRLRNGVLLDSGFFFGPRGFYAGLRSLPPEERRLFAMRGISFINELYGPEAELKIAQRRQARFINTTMMVTGLGAAVSDGLSDGRVVSGVGGQYNFVAMAHALPEARSVLCLRSTRAAQGRVSSNIVWNYGHVTVPRHLRDVVVTEYGIADLRGRTDAEVVEALVQVMDARFQPEFVASARASGKLPSGYRIPERARSNLPERLERELAPYREQGLFVELPFGGELSEEEIILGKALRRLSARAASPGARIRSVLGALSGGSVDSRLQPYLQRMSLDSVHSWSERMQQRLVADALAEVLAGQQAR